MAINETFDGQNRIDSIGRRALRFCFSMVHCEFWGGAWLKQQEFLRFRLPSRNGSERWTGTVQRSPFRNVASRLQARFERLQNAVPASRLTTIKAGFAATSSGGAIASESG